MSAVKSKVGIFTLEGLNGLGTTFFFYDLYFYTRDTLKFSTLQNLLLAAVLGASYAVAAFFGGRFAQKFGYLTAVRCGTALMTSVFLLGSFVTSLPLILAIIMMGNVGMCLTWPALEALMSEGEPPVRLRRLVGIYNVIWSLTGAVAYFLGGLMQQKLGPKSIFYVSGVLLFLEFILATWLSGRKHPEPSPSAQSITLETVQTQTASGTQPAVFLKMALLANPLAYLAINTVLSTLPTVAANFRFTLMEAGFVCSIWLFARVLIFIFLCQWTAWQYRFRYLLGAYLALIISFTVVLLAPNLPSFVLAQVVFGGAIGLIYYSSLYYSMDVSEAKGELGGIHEAAIGLGNGAGPAMAAAGMTFFPRVQGSAAAAVCLLLLGGLGGLFWLRGQPRFKGAKTISADT